jgi:branched-subunit amino acid aminotransferase/4-amino-4-deoxychorismate lyase
MHSYIFQDGSLTPKESHESVLVADSFLVEDGKVRSLQLHQDRFLRGLKDKASQLLETYEYFMQAALALIPRTGLYFPRFEVQNSESPVFVFMLREAPEKLGPATLWTYPYPDPRKDLSTKGPELSLGVELRSLAQAQGADETILLNEHGEISEGALSSLVWWRGDVLCAPGNDIPWLESVTREEIFQIAESMGIKTRFEHAIPEELVGLELWLLSSLQGIRTVKSWVGVSENFPQAQNATAFEKRMKMLASALP